MSRLYRISLVPLIFFLPGLVMAQHKGISFQAVIKTPAGKYPTVSGLTVTTQILDPVTYCVLREEEHSGKNLSNGYLNLVIGDSNATTPLGKNPTPVLSIAEVMDNSKKREGLNCVDINDNIVSTNMTYTPSNLDRRILRVRLNVQGDEVVADFNMRAIPFAVNSEMLNSKTDTDFLNVNETKGLTQENAESIFNRFSKLDAILTQFNSSGTTLDANITGNAATATNVAGVVGITNGGTGATTQSGAAKAILPDQSGQGGKYLTTDGNDVAWVDLQSIATGVWGININGNAATATTATNFSGSLAGDVSGTQGSTVVEKIKGQSVSATGSAVGQVLRYEGSNTWTPGFVAMTDLKSSVTGGNSFASSCGANQTLVYNSVGDVMSCSNISITKSQVSDFPTLGTLAAKSSLDLASTDAIGITPVSKGGTGTNNGSITGTGALAFTAGGANQNVTLNPSGTGYTILNGNVGIGTTTPGVALDVIGNIRPGSTGVTTGGACIGEGSFGYDLTAHALVYCSNTGLWTALGGGGGGFGTAQTWTDVTGSRTLGTTYTNSTGKAIEVHILGYTGGAGGGYIYAIINGITVPMGNWYAGGGSYPFTGSVVVPSGATYSVNYSITAGSPSYNQWVELR
ncbi:hypothetical protein [Bdellovibrio sp.]|uniref:hypothetical protein n=1 Tax=Bdellovibrio sp. TaxID=28201 RepID=UPI0039E50468